MGIIETFTGRFQKSNQIIVGSVLGLHNIMRNKIVRFPCTVIYSRQSSDNELKEFLKSSIQYSLDHINKIVAFLKERGFNTPPTESLQRVLNDNGQFAVSRSIMDDKKISAIMREFLGLSLSIEAEAIRNAIEPDCRKLIYDILHTDNEENYKLVCIQESKGWTDNSFPPYLGPPQ
jgi:spore coat protein CotF